MMLLLLLLPLPLLLLLLGKYPSFSRRLRLVQLYILNFLDLRSVIVCGKERWWRFDLQQLPPFHATHEVGNVAWN